MRHGYGPRRVSGRKETATNRYPRTMTENKMLPKGDLRFSCSMLMRVVVLLFSLISDFFCGVATISGIVLVSPGQYEVAQSLCKSRGEYLSALEGYPIGPMQYCAFAPNFIVP